MLVSDIRVVSSRYSCELQAQVKGKGLRKPFRLRYLSPLAFERFIDPDNGDPFFAAALLLAMKNHDPLQISASDVVKRFQCGYVVENGNSEELRQAIRNILVDSELAPRMGANGIDATRKTFDFERMAEGFT